MSPFSLVLPLHPRHDRFVSKFLRGLTHESALVRELVIARSETSSSRGQAFEKAVTRELRNLGLSFDLSFVFSRGRMTAGQNRNAAIAVASSEFVVMSDADDEYSPHRLRTLAEHIHQTEPDLVLHHYFLSSEAEGFTYIPPGEITCLNEGQLFAATFPEGYRNRIEEGTFPGDTNICLPGELKSLLRVHHGHIAVRKTIADNVSFGTLTSGEDGQYCRDVLWNGYKVLYLGHALSRYLPQNSSLPNLSRLRRIKVKAIARFNAR
jgi:hypothetical protein